MCPRCCQEGAQLVESMHYYPLLLFHVGANETCKLDPGRNQERLQSPGGASKKYWCSSLLGRNGIPLSRRGKGVFWQQSGQLGEAGFKLKDLGAGVHSSNAHTIATILA